MRVLCSEFLVLVYVDDLLIASCDEKEGADFLQKLMGIWKFNRIGKISPLKRGLLQFLGRTSYRDRDGESSLILGVSEAYMVGIIDNWHEKLKSNEAPPKLEEIFKDREKQGDDSFLTAEGEARYRRVLGQLAWAALSRADLCFSGSYLARFQSKPKGAAEACLRAMLRWFLRGVMERGPRVRRSVDVSRLLHQGVFTQTRMSRIK